MSFTLSIIMNLAFMAQVSVSSPAEQVMWSDEVIQGFAIDAQAKSYRPVNIKVDKQALDTAIQRYNLSDIMY